MTPTPATGPRTTLLARIPAILKQHAGHEPWGGNNGSVGDVLEAWQLNPTDFMESLLGWGYTIVPDRETEARDGLDVERLAAAWAEVMDGRRIGNRDVAVRLSGADTHPDDWAAIAAAYGPQARSPEAQAGEQRLLVDLWRKQGYAMHEEMAADLRTNTGLRAVRATALLDCARMLEDVLDGRAPLAALRESREGSGG